MKIRNKNVNKYTNLCPRTQVLSQRTLSLRMTTKSSWRKMPIYIFDHIGCLGSSQGRIWVSPMKLLILYQDWA